MALKEIYEMAIDDITYVDCDADDPPDLAIDCDFETDLCSWTQTLNRDQGDWVRESDGDWQQGGGPGFDHTTGEGFYVYYSSHNQQKGDTALLSSPPIKATASEEYSCLKFWYHIYGEEFDFVSLNYLTENNKNKLWTIGGTQGNLWKEAHVDVKSGQEVFMVSMERSSTFTK